MYSIILPFKTDSTLLSGYKDCCLEKDFGDKNAIPKSVLIQTVLDKLFPVGTTILELIV